MGITQFEAVKALPYILSNLLSLLTCFPLAFVVMIMVYYLQLFFKNKFLLWIGSISYEIYLVHAFTLSLISRDVIRIIIFLIITTVLALALHYFTKMKIK